MAYGKQTKSPAACAPKKGHMSPGNGTGMDAEKVPSGNYTEILGEAHGGDPEGGRQNTGRRSPYRV